MSSAFKFIRKHWLTLGLLIIIPIALNWVVVHNRPPGSMTVIEAQSMDMTEMKAPVGVMPVGAETVSLVPIEGGKSFPAVVSALTDEDVVARVPGRVSRLLVYPGDKVEAGQLLATIDAPEYDASLHKAQAMSEAKSAEVVSAERMVAHHRNALDSAKATLEGAKTARRRAQTDVEASGLERDKTQADLQAAQAGLSEKQAALTYAGKETVRQRELYKKGAISLDELQMSERDQAAAAAQVEAAQAAIDSAKRSVGIAEKRLVAARQMVQEADSQVAIAQAGTAQANEGIAQSHADANAKRFESNAAVAEASGASVLVDYRQLKALGSGVVSERLVSPGTPVMPGQVILRLKSLGVVRVQADVPQALSGSLEVGTPVLIKTEAGDKEAVITSVFPAVDPQTRTFKVEAKNQNIDGLLKPGMFATIEIRGTGKAVLAVKSSAIQSDESGKFVWTVQHRAGTGVTDWTCTMHPEVSEKGPGKCPKCGMDLTQREKGGSLFAHRTIVTTGEASGERVEVLTGLKSGDQVIWAGFENLIEGTSVKPTTWGANGPSEIPTGEANQSPAMKDMPGMSGMKMPETKPQPAEPKATQTTRESKPSNAVYVCPMDKDVVSDKPGKCPKCGMELVKKEDSK